MKIYLIIAHKSPQHVKRLVVALNDDTSMFFIHLDKRVTLDLFKPLFKDCINVEFVEPRAQSIWGGFGILEAHINSYLFIKKRVEHFSHVILLSGQDFPLKTNDYINTFLQNHLEHSFIEYFPLPNAGWGPFGGMERYQKFHLQFTRLPVFVKRLQRVFNFAYKLKWYRKIPKGMKPFGGSDWYILNKKAFDYMVDFIVKNKRIVSFFKFGFHPYELFFQTVLLNAGDEIASSLINDNKKYTNWSKPAGPYPAILLKEDLPLLLNTDKLFARKFDLDIDYQVVDELEQNLQQNKS